MSTITVFTPAYNRAHTLSRTYESLRAQDCKDFVWLIIDDGSTDNTAEIVHKWQNEDNGFDIKYIYKDNGGMHTAHNTAYDNIDTELCVCIDSDDMLSKGAIKNILSKWSEVKDDGYAGIIGLDADFDGNVIGTKFSDGQIDTTLEGFYASGGTGDKKLVYRTDIVNKYPRYPVFSNEKYVALGYLYKLIDQDYKLAVLNEILCDVEYQADGSSNTMWRQYKKNPQGFAFWRQVCMKYPVSKKRLFVDCCHYVSHSIISKNVLFIKESPKKLYTVLAIPLGTILAIITCVKGR